MPGGLPGTVHLSTSPLPQSESSVIVLLLWPHKLKRLQNTGKKFVSYTIIMDINTLISMMLWLSSSFFKRALYVIKSSWDCSVLIACTTGLLLVDVFWLPPLALLVECCLARFRFGVPFESSGDEEFEIDSYFMDHSDSLSRTGMYRSPPSGRYRVRDRDVCIRWEPPWCWKFMNWNSGVEVSKKLKSYE